MTDYIPVPCAEYSVYELAIMHGEKLCLIWSEANVTYAQVITPLDLKTRNREEFLVCRNIIGETLIIRLDRIRRRKPWVKP